MNQAYKDYVNNCATYVSDYLDNNKHLILYIKNKSNERTGVVIAVKMADGDKETIKYALSRCHSTRDRFNKWVGLKKALDRIEDHKDYNSFFKSGKHPRRVVKTMNELYERSIKYFKDIKN